MGKTIDSVMRYLLLVARVCIVIAAIIVTAISLIWTVSTDYGETSFTFSTSSCWIVALSAIIFVLLLAFTPFIRVLTMLGTKCLSIYAGLISGLIAIIWVFAANVGVVWDSLDLWVAANDPDAVQWEHAGYMERYPYQASMIAALRICQWFAGSNALLLFQLGNAVCVGLASWTTVRLVHEWTQDDHAASIAAVLQIMFLPPALYATFVYGNQFALTFVLIAFLFQAMGFNTNKLPWHCMSALAMLVAIIAKRTFTIAVVALVLSWLIYALKKNDWKIVFPILITLALTLIIPTSIDSAILHRYKANPNNALPKTTWLVMGLGANNNGTLSKYQQLGMFDGYTVKIPADSYSPERQTELNQKLVSRRLSHFKDDPLDAAHFIAKKLVYEWGDPTYGSITASNWTRGTTPPISDRPKTVIANSVYDGKLHTIIVFLMDTFASIISFGYLAAFLSSKNKYKYWGIAFCITGGFLLYIAWEAKSQYTLPFVQLMIPYAAIGIQLLTESLTRKRLFRK